MIYLDNNATTLPTPAVLAAMRPFLGFEFANPNSLHAAGERARAAVESAREEVAAFVGARPKEIVFVSSATEALNTVIRGLLFRSEDDSRAKRHVVATAVEHPAVLQPLADLETRGYTVTRVGVDSAGRLDQALFRASLRDDTALAIAMAANNETGVIFPFAECAAAAGAAGVPFLCDAVQAVGKIPFDAEESGADYVVFSSHKIRGPKGAAALVVRRGAPFEPLVIGGGQERSRRAGTENVAAIAGFAAACREASLRVAEASPRVARLRDRLERLVTDRIAGVHVNGARAPRIPNTLSLAIGGIEGEAALLLLDKEGVAVSTGSACAAGSMDPSHVLTAMGIAVPLSLGALRFSLSDETTDAEVAFAAEALGRVVQTLRALSPFDPVAGPPASGFPSRTTPDASSSAISSSE
jgi:cysteine desulfurase